MADYVQLVSGEWVRSDRARELDQVLASQQAVREAAPELPTFPTTDAGNAEFLAHLYRDQVRFDHRRRRWLVWRGHRWEPDRDGYVARLAIEAARKRYEQAASIGDLRERQRVATWAVSSESRQKVDACLALAKNLLPIADKGDGWDSDPWLLGVPNGVLDLKTGELRPGRPEDHITMTTGIPFDAHAKCPRWERFLEEVFVDRDLIQWIRRALGYSLTGDTSEQVVFLGYGIGANGKGAFANALHYALGDYAYSAPFSTFELYQRAGIPNDLASLENRRFVCSSETNDDTRLNEARIKALSGCDPMTARYLHQEFFTFMPHLKLWLACNHRPRVLDDSFGFWRRVRLIPFTQQFSGKSADPRLGEKLRAEAPGILAWLIRSCLEWQRGGLEPVPNAVRAATSAYQQESDPLGSFISECCLEVPHATAQAAALYAAYKTWAESQGLSQREMFSSTQFGRRMADRFQKTKTRERTIYQGIGLLEPTTPDTDPEHKCGGSVTGLTLNFSPSNVSPIANPLREKTLNNPPQPTTKHENPPQPRLGVDDNGCQPTTDWGQLFPSMGS